MKRKLVLIMSLTLLIGMLSVSFNVQRAKASGPVYIRADGSIDPPDAPIVTADNVTYLSTGNINSSVDGIVIERSNVILDGGGYGVQGTGTWAGISLSGRSNVTIKNMTIRTFWYGIVLDSYADYNSISGNIITNNEWGITLDFSSSNSISGNNITANNYTGIGLDSSSNYNDISGNNITNNIEGIRLYESSGNSMVGNNITANDGGDIVLGNSSNNNTISGNNITASWWEGIFLFDSSNNNTVSGNNITANSNYGIRLDGSSGNSIVGNTITNSLYGIYVSYPSNNRFYHNNFVDNIQQVNISSAVPSLANVWDDGYPSGGNYWSDYNGTDANHDGIGDTPYVIDANNTDHYPLMTSYTIPEFPSFLVLPLFMIATLLAVIVYRRKHALTVSRG